MAIQYRATPVTSDIPISNIRPADPHLPPDIPYSGPQETPSATETTNAPVGGGLITEAAPLSTLIPTTSVLSTTNTPSPTTSATSSPATSAAAAALGLTPGKLTAAIVVLIAFLAIIIPILVLSFLSYQRKKEEREYAAHRASQRNSRERIYISEKQQKYSAPSRPQRQEERTKSQQQKEKQPTRNSLGLFNFKLSTPTSPTPTNAPASPNFRLSVARALKLRRSDVSVVQSNNRSSGQSAQSAQRRNQESQQSTTRQPTNRNLRQSFPDPLPPYASPRPSSTQAQTSHFAPLERIGTRNIAERRSYIAGQLSNSGPVPPIPTTNTLRPQSRDTARASSEVLQSPDAYGRAQAHSTSTTLSWRLSAHNNGPFSYDLPERLSDVSRLSFDTSQWTTDHPRGLYRASVVSAVSSDESSTMHPVRWRIINHSYAVSASTSPSPYFIIFL